MSWFVVGGVAIGATAGAAIGSEKGGDDVWKGALIGGALGAAGGAGAGLGSGAGVLGGIGAETAAVAPTVGVTALPAAGTVEAGSGLALGGGALETGGAMAGGGSGITAIAPTTTTAATTAATPTATAPAAGAWGSGFGPGATQSSIAGGALDTGTAGFGSTGGATVGGEGGGSFVGSQMDKAANVSPLQTAFDSTLKAMSDHPFLTAGAAYFGLNALGAFDNQNEGQPFGTNTQTAAGYPMSPSFKPSREDPEKYRYTARYAAEGGIMGYAPGGMVQQDPMNPIQNPIYPQSQQQQTNFATSSQYPNSIKSAMAADYDARTNPMTGQEMPMGMAQGGIAHFRKGGTNYSEMAAEFAAMSDRRLGAKSPGSRSFQTRDFPSVESTGVYRDTDPATRYKNAVDAAIYQNAALAKKYDVGGPQLKVPSGGLGSINMGPMSKEKKGTSGEAEEDFAAGGMARYATGGQPQNDDPIKTIVMMNQPRQENTFESNPAIRHIAGLPQLPQQQAPSAFDHPAMRHIAGQKVTQADFDAWNNRPQMAAGGISSLGGYAHGGNPRLLRGPGDGMSDDIPATIGDRQPARLADGEFVIPADVVSALGNGSTEAGAKHLHAMMDRTRQKAHGKKTQMKKVNPKKVMPA